MANLSPDNSTSNQSKSYLCPECKDECDNTDCILCDYCSNWYHDSCSKLSKKKLVQHRLNQNQIEFICTLCKKKRMCHNCQVPVGSIPRDCSIYCVNCCVLLCQQCSGIAKEDILKFYTSDETS